MTFDELVTRLQAIRDSWEFAPGAPWPGYERAIQDIDALLAEINQPTAGDSA